jgi:hypothetical protein
MHSAATNRYGRLLLGLSSLVLAGTPVCSSAQEAISTAAHVPGAGAPLAPASVRPLSLDDDIRDQPGFLRPSGPCGGPAKTEAGKTDKTPHGEVWAGAGTHGYREAGGAICVPIGDNGAVSIVIDAGRIDGRSGRWR